MQASRGIGTGRDTTNWPSLVQPAAARAGPASRATEWWALLMLVVPIYGTFWPPQTYFYVGEFSQQEFGDSSLMPIFLLVLAGTVAVTYLSLARRMRVRHDLLIYLYAAFALLSITVASDPAHSFLRMLRLLPPIGFGVLYAQAFDRRRLTAMMTLAFLISALLSIMISVAFPAYGGSHLTGAYDNAWRGAMEHKNSTGAIYGLGVLVTLHALVTREARAALAGPALAACALMLFKAQSATAVSATVIALPFYLLLLGLRRARPTFRVLILLSAVLAVATLVTLINQFPQLLFSAAGRDSSLTGRTDIWAAVWQEIQRQPIRGHGYSFWTEESEAHTRIGQMVTYMPAHSHDDWLDLWLQVGIGGVIVVALDYLLSFARGLGGLLSGRVPGLELPLAVLLFLLIHSFTEVQIDDPGITGVFWLAWAAVLLRSPGRPTDRRDAGLRPLPA